MSERSRYYRQIWEAARDENARKRRLAKHPLEITDPVAAARWNAASAPVRPRLRKQSDFSWTWLFLCLFVTLLLLAAAQSNAALGAIAFLVVIGFVILGAIGLAILEAIKKQ